MTVGAHRQDRHSAGFTLIEMLVSLAIIALITSIAAPAMQTIQKSHQEAELRDALMTIRGALDAYKQASDNRRIPVKVGSSGYPSNLDELWMGVTDLSSPTPRKIYFLRRLPRCPLYSGAVVPAAQTWGTRSYESPPDHPEEGDDVFDVYCKAAGVGLNGVPYNEW